VTWERAKERPLPAATEAFLSDGNAPVLVTLGASTAMHPGDFFEHATRVVLDVGARALVVTGPAHPPRHLAALADVHVTDYAPFSQVMPRCRAAIHHGGAGTTVAAIRAGIPQVAVPRGFDQPDTAARIRALGIGLAVSWRGRHRRLAPTARRVIAEPRFGERAAALSARIADEDGASESADAIEAHLT
jgi:rhamnosyltransferase subunit B